MSSDKKGVDDYIFEALKGYVSGPLKKGIIKMAVKQITGFLFKKIAFLAWGPVGSIVTYFVTKGVVLIIDKTIIGAHVLYIYGDTHFDKQAVVKVIMKFRELDKEGLTDEQKKKIDIDLANAGRELIRFGTI